MFTEIEQISQWMVDAGMQVSNCWGFQINKGMKLEETM